MGKITSKIKQYKFVCLGIAGVILLYVGVAGIISTTAPWFLNDNSDEIAHVDMIYRIYNGDLPKAGDGVRYKPFIDQGGANVYQRAAGNPPLFYVLHAPFVGPLLKMGEWKKAIAVGRAINMFFSVLLIFALAWAGWLFGGKRKELFAVAVPALAVLTYRHTRLNVDYALDGLLTLWTTLTIIILAKIIQNGLKPKYLIWLSLVSAAGTATKASYIIFLPLSLLVIMMVSLRRYKGSFYKKALKGMALAALVTVFVVIAAGWYYYFWNYKTSGNWYNPLPPNFDTGRPYKSLSNVALNPGFWALFYARYAAVPSTSIAMTSFAVAGLLAMPKSVFLKLKNNKTTSQIVLLMVFAFLATVLTQVKLAVGYGAFNFRYLLPAMLPIGLLLAYGLLQFKWLRGQLVAIFAIGLAGTSLLSLGLRPTTEGLVQGADKWGAALGKIYKLAASNGVPAIIISVLFAALLLGAVLLSTALFKLSTEKKS